MYRRYYDGYNNYPADRGEAVIPTPEEALPRAEELPCPEEGQAAVASLGSRRRGGLLGGLEIDDLILIGVLLLVLQESVDDKILLIALGFVFLSGFWD